MPIDKLLDLEGATIVSLEPYKTGRYLPSRDVKGVWSRILVTYMAGPPPEPGSLSGKWDGHIEVLASLGASWHWEESGDAGAARQTLINSLHKHADGLYVLHARMIGGGEDVEFDVFDIQPMTPEERRWVQENSDFTGVEHLWAREYREVPCHECKQPLAHHKGWEMNCPKDEKEAAEAKAHWEQAWATVEAPKA